MVEVEQGTLAVVMSLGRSMRREKERAGEGR